MRICQATGLKGLAKCRAAGLQSCMSRAALRYAIRLGCAGKAAALMKAVVTNLAEDTSSPISAYVASLLRSEHYAAGGALCTGGADLTLRR